MQRYRLYPDDEAKDAGLSLEHQDGRERVEWRESNHFKCFFCGQLGLEEAYSHDVPVDHLLSFL